MYVLISFKGDKFLLPDTSKKMDVRELRAMVTEKTGLPAEKQRLFFLGKQLEDGNMLVDYKINVNSIIQVMERADPLPVAATNAGNAEDAEDGGSAEDVGNAEDKENQDDNAMDEAARNRPGTSSGNGDDSAAPVNLADIYDGDPSELEGPECEKCGDNKRRKCKECGCNKCGGKTPENELIFCDECQYVFHFACLDPPLTSLPDGDWYCPDCRNDADEVVQPGQKLKASKKREAAPRSKNKKWSGRGMATAGRSKQCTKVPADHFGPIPGVEVGMSWFFRVQVSEEGVHRPPVGGIHGKESVGAFSIVLAGGYVGDTDDGEEFFFTGSGGRDLSGNKRVSDQSKDQELTKCNLALARNCAADVNEKGNDAGDRWREGKPLRVCRSEKMKKSRHGKYAPNEGVRYDGIYKVVKYWSEKGPTGHIIWRYHMRRDDPEPAPWTEEGKAKIAEKGFTCVYPENYKEAQALKAAEKAAKEAEKAAAKEESKKGKKRKGDIMKGTTIKFAKPSAFKPNAMWLQLMKADVLNKKVWDEALEMPKANLLEFTDFVKVLFTCVCCQDTVAQPLTPSCGHNVCKDCLARSFKAECYNCPTCRADLKGEKPKVNKELQEVLDKIFPGYRQS